MFCYTVEKQKINALQLLAEKTFSTEMEKNNGRLISAIS